MLIVFICVNIGLALLLGFVFGKTRFFSKNVLPKFRWLKAVVGIAVFGGSSIIGTVVGVNIEGALLNARDAAPLCGGAWFGPVVGIGAAVVGAGFRFMLGGASVIPCCISTLLAGIIGSVLYSILRGKMTVFVSVIAAAAVGCIHMLLLVLLMPDGSGLPVAFGPVGIGTLLLVVCSTLAFSLSYRLTYKEADI